MAARISEVGLNAPQVGQRITPGHTVAAQRLQTSLGKNNPVLGKPSPGPLVGRNSYRGICLTTI
jgi:hypothetical protein